MTFFSCPHRSLSSTALDALKAFYAERDARAEHFRKLKTLAEEQHAADVATAAAGANMKLSMEAFTEDWNESQFWVGSPSRSNRPPPPHGRLVNRPLMCRSGL